MPIRLLSEPLVMPSPFLTSLFPTVRLYLIAVAADVWKLETLALVVYRYGVVTVWITNVVRIHVSWAMQLSLTMKLPMFPRINWQVRHHQVPDNLLSQPLILSSPFLTTSAWFWTGYNHQWLPGEPIWHLGLPALTTFFLPPFQLMSNPSFVWAKQDPAFMLKLKEDGYILKLSIGRKTHSLSNWGKLGQNLCLRWADWSGPTLMEEHLSQLPRWPALHYLSCSYINIFITRNKKIILLAWRNAYLVGSKGKFLSCCLSNAQFNLD